MKRDFKQMSIEMLLIMALDQGSREARHEISRRFIAVQPKKLIDFLYDEIRNHNLLGARNHDYDSKRSQATDAARAGPGATD